MSLRELQYGQVPRRVRAGKEGMEEGGAPAKAIVPRQDAPNEVKQVRKTPKIESLAASSDRKEEKSFANPTSNYKLAR